MAFLPSAHRSQRYVSSTRRGHSPSAGSGAHSAPPPLLQPAGIAVTEGKKPFFPQKKAARRPVRYVFRYALVLTASCMMHADTLGINPSIQNTTCVLGRSLQGFEGQKFRPHFPPHPYEWGYEAGGGCPFLPRGSQTPLQTPDLTPRSQELDTQHSYHRTQFIAWKSNARGKLTSACPRSGLALVTD